MSVRLMVVVHLFSEDSEDNFPDLHDRVGGGRTRTIKPKQVLLNGFGTTWHLTHLDSPDTDKTCKA